MRIWSDELPLDVTHVGGPAHTDNDSLVWLPEQKVLLCGDLLFNGGTPFVLMGSVTGAIRVLSQADLGECAGWLDVERIVGNLHRAYVDLDPTSGPVDIVAALTDMVAYNGGRPLTCHA